MKTGVLYVCGKDESESVDSLRPLPPLYVERLMMEWAYG
jgi:hypothetical protein